MRRAPEEAKCIKSKRCTRTIAFVRIQGRRDDGQRRHREGEDKLLPMIREKQNAAPKVSRRNNDDDDDAVTKKIHTSAPSCYAQRREPCHQDQGSSGPPRLHHVRRPQWHYKLLFAKIKKKKQGDYDGTACVCR